MFDFLYIYAMLVLLPEWWNWYTRTTQNRVSKGMGVQVSPPAQMKNPKGIFSFVSEEKANCLAFVET